MKAAILEEFGAPLVVEEVELLPPGPQQVVVRTTATVFCATDWMNQSGRLGKELPTILGHSGVGVVDAVGSRVDELEVGQRAVVPGTPECGRCCGRCRMRRDIPRFVQMLEVGLVTAEPIVTSRYTLDEINDTLAASEERRDLSGVLVLDGA